jgi:hypothetical protein
MRLVRRVASNSEAAVREEATLGPRSQLGAAGAQRMTARERMVTCEDVFELAKLECART